MTATTRGEVSTATTSDQSTIRKGPSVLSRVFAILDAFAERGPELSHAAITRATGLAPATAHRLLSELVEWGAVERVGRGRYRIGMRLWRLGALAPGGRDLRDAALPYLQDLLQVVHEVVHLAVLDADQVMYIEKLEARPGVSVVSKVGLRLPLHATGPGKVLLAYGPPELAERVLNGPLRRHPSRTITSPALLRSTLAAIRQQGFAVSRDEMTEGAASVAAPVRDGTDQVVASISVVVPSTVKDLAPLVPLVRLAALGVTRELRRNRPGHD